MAGAENSAQAFDLNIEKVLEHWAIPFAIRELIANALDEQMLTGTPEPVIFKDGQGDWHMTSGTPDGSLDFESELSRLLGVTAAAALVGAA